jgi:hypothetical protein
MDAVYLVACGLMGTSVYRDHSTQSLGLDHGLENTRA